MENTEDYGLFFEEEKVLCTSAGDLVPAFVETPRRKYKYSVEYYKTGGVKSVYLNDIQRIMTPAGIFPAEYVTFYESGNLKRFFPTDGKLSGFWGEEDEKTMNVPISLEFSFAAFTAYLSGVYFYESGKIKSVTLYPNEFVDIMTSQGTIKTRVGFSLYEDGKLRSLEPALPTKITTKDGTFRAYDINANCVNADRNSLEFGADGGVISFVDIDKEENL
ncbi:hypothetical protein AGMMS49975_04690 [Clostridia bacterium]|nr:hypothetical protein AGMMS49975_04690 [Clostridia bacterium]